jgi:type I restriction enzyme S subunit
VKSALADPSYIALILNSPEITEVIEAMKSGISDSGLNLTQDKFLSINIPTPPLAEQRRIVARIEALFARTRRARADLERVAPLASRYRRQALQHVFDDAASSFDAVRLGALLAAIEAGKNIRCEERRPHAGERGIVKISAVTWGRFDAEEIKTAPADAHLDSRTRIAEGDFLLSRANTLELVGAPVIADGVPPDTYLSDKVLRLRFHDRVEPWVMWFLRSPPGRSEIEGRSSGNQLSMRNIGQGALREIPVPLPGNPERVRLVSVIEQQHGAADRAEHEATRALALLDRLEQSILARAFRGELVPQDATNEPADVSVAHTSTADSPRSQPASRRGRGRPRKQRVS